MSACVRCGYCCQKSPCPYGDGVPCVHLVPDPSSTAGQYLCGKHAEISVDPMSEFAPAFGAGCCSPLFNTARDAVLISLGRKQ